MSIYVQDVDPDAHFDHDTMGAEQSKLYTHKADKNDASSIWQDYDFFWTNPEGNAP